MEAKSIFGKFLPEFSAEYDLKRFDWQNNRFYPSDKTELDEMEGNL